MKRRKAFTIVEILISLAVVAVLFGLIFSFYQAAIERSKHVEAVATVDSISKAEELYQMNNGEYVAAANTQEVNEKLGLNIEPKWYTYKVIGVTNDNFIILAEKILDDIENGNISPDDTIAKNRSGPISPESAPTGENNPPGEGAPPGESSPSGGPSSGGPGGGTPGGGQPGDNSQGPPSGTPGGGGPAGGGEHQTTFNNTISDIISALDNSIVGHDNVTLLTANNVTVMYGDLLSMGALGLTLPPYWFDFTDDFQGMFPANTIILDNSYKYLAPEVGATVLMHESTHISWAYNTDQWADYSVNFWADHGAFPPLVQPADLPVTKADLSWIIDPITGVPYLNDSVTQEYSAFYNEIQAWKEFKGHNKTLSDPDEDPAEVAYDNGDLLAYVADLYIGYNPYHAR